MYFVLIFVFVEEEVFLVRIVGPYVLDGFIDFTFIFKFLKVFYHFHRSARAHSIVNQFVLRCGPWCVFEF